MPVHYEPDGAIVVVTLDRPEVGNAIDRPTAEALAEAFRRFDADASLAVAVLTGAGGRFCCGADLKAMRAGDPDRITRVAPDGDGPVGPTRMLLGKPVIAAVEGYAVAGGLELAAWCDLRVAATDAVFGVFCRRWGIPLMDGGTVRLPRLVGQSHALDLILTGRGVSGDEALRMGLANRLVPPGETLAAAVALARDIASRPQAALRSDRRSAYEQWSLDLDAALLGEYHHGVGAVESGELFAGLEAYAGGAWRAGAA
jgi:enoyl-CoA hydratase